MRRLPILCVGVAAAGLLTAGCGGSASPHARTAAQSSLSPSASATGGTPAGAGAPAATASAASAAPSSSARSGSGSGPKQSQTATSPSLRQGGSTTQALPPLTKQGSYTYAVRGTDKSPFGNKDINENATLTVDPPSGRQQHQALKGADVAQAQTVAVQTGGYYLVDITISTQGFNEEFHANPPVLYTPVNAKPGQQWSWQLKSDDGKYTVHTSSTFVGDQTVATTGGQSLTTSLVHSVVTISGNGINATSTQDDWLSRTYVLIVKEHAVMHGTGYGQTFDSDVTRTLVSAHPA